MLSVPILYPQNIIAWSHARHAILDLGRSYNYRIQAFTAFFGLYCVLAVIVLFFTVLAVQQQSLQTMVIAAMAFLADVIFGTGVVAQIVQGSRINRMSLVHQRTLNHIESLVYEYLATARYSLPGAVRDRLLQTKKVAASVVEGIAIEERLRPARVMGIPATPGLLSTAASITVSGVIAAFQVLRSSSSGGVATQSSAPGGL